MVAPYDAHNLEPLGPPIPVSQLAIVDRTAPTRMVVADSGNENVVDVAHHQVLDR
jgi:hypothetical protein